MHIPRGRRRSFPGSYKTVVRSGGTLEKQCSMGRKSKQGLVHWKPPVGSKKKQSNGLINEGGKTTRWMKRGGA